MRFMLLLTVSFLYCMASAVAIADARIPDRTDTVYLKSAPDTPIECTIVGESKYRILVVLKEDSTEKVFDWKDIEKLKRGADTPMQRGVQTKIIDGEKYIDGEGYRQEGGADDLVQWLLEQIPGIDLGDATSHEPDVRVLPHNRRYILDKITNPDKKGDVSRPLPQQTQNTNTSPVPENAETAFNRFKAQQTVSPLPADALAFLKQKFQLAFKLAAKNDPIGIRVLRDIYRTAGIVHNATPIGPLPAMLPAGWKTPEPAPATVRLKRRRNRTGDDTPVDTPGD